MDPTEGLVLHMVALDDHGRHRTILHRASVTEMVVPYGEPGPMHGWKNAFDAGEWGLGRMANSLVLGCDCLGEVHYLDAVCCTEKGNPFVLQNAICIHEEDYGILWKHIRHVRRTHRGPALPAARRELDIHRRQLRVRLLLVLLPRRDHAVRGEADRRPVDDGGRAGRAGSAKFASMIAPQLAAPFHQHLFNVRLDVEVDGPRTASRRSTSSQALRVPTTRWTTPSRRSRPFSPPRRRPAGASIPSRSRTWRIVEPQRDEPARARPSPTSFFPARPRRCSPATRPASHEGAGIRQEQPLGHALSTPPNEEPPAITRTSTPGATGFPASSARTARSSTKTSSSGTPSDVTHIPRPEDWPVMPVEYAGFSLFPSGSSTATRPSTYPPTDSCKSEGHGASDQTGDRFRDQS